MHRSRQTMFTLTEQPAAAWAGSEQRSARQEAVSRGLTPPGNLSLRVRMRAVPRCVSMSVGAHSDASSRTARFVYSPGETHLNRLYLPAQRTDRGITANACLTSRPNRRRIACTSKICACTRPGSVGRTPQAQPNTVSGPRNHTHGHCCRAAYDREEPRGPSTRAALAPR